MRKIVVKYDTCSDAVFGFDTLKQSPCPRCHWLRPCISKHVFRPEYSMCICRE